MGQSAKVSIETG